MKILLLSFEFPSETGFGGIGTYTWYQAKALVKLGHTVHVLAGANSPAQLYEEEQDGVKIFRIKTRAPFFRAGRFIDYCRLWWSKNRMENGCSMFSGYRELRNKFNYDIIEMPECGAEGLWINHISQAKTVVRFHSPASLIMPFYQVSNLDIKVCSALEQIALKGAGAYSSCSQYLKNEVQQRLGIRKAVSVISNGIDLDLFDRGRRTSFPGKYSLSSDRPVILFSGRMEYRKGIHLCMDIVASILTRYKAAFVFAGQDLFGYMKDSLLPYLNSLKLKGSVHYLGKLDQGDVRSALEQAHIFFMPSLWENCPYSCLEAMAAGKAIVSTDQGGMTELIEDGVNGLLAQNGKSESFIRCIERLLEDQGLREKLGKAARERVEKDHRDIDIAQQSLSFYRKCLEMA